ncbi:hypothetical protein V6N12_042272 [Hibiscus sabdariffa]|uniref:Uncharacterized protein n=1 Tax=Hibiscus sabdariffa TaxID=183260 RepID=A0ABR2EEA4_9ROSI
MHRHIRRDDESNLIHGIPGIIFQQCCRKRLDLRDRNSKMKNQTNRTSRVPRWNQQQTLLPVIQPTLPASPIPLAMALSFSTFRSDETTSSDFI